MWMREIVPRQSWRIAPGYSLPKVRHPRDSCNRQQTEQSDAAEDIIFFNGLATPSRVFGFSAPRVIVPTPVTPCSSARPSSRR
jgi:hypothetical protein